MKFGAFGALQYSLGKDELQNPWLRLDVSARGVLPDIARIGCPLLGLDQLNSHSRKVATAFRDCGTKEKAS